MNMEILDELSAKETQKTIRMLKALVKKLERGELVSMEHGFWEGTHGKWNFHVVARESDDFRPFTENVR